MADDDDEGLVTLGATRANVRQILSILSQHGSKLSEKVWFGLRDRVVESIEDVDRAEHELQRLRKLTRSEGST